MEYVECPECGEVIPVHVDDMLLEDLITCDECGKVWTTDTFPEIAYLLSDDQEVDDGSE